MATFVHAWMIEAALASVEAEALSSPTQTRNDVDEGLSTLAALWPHNEGCPGGCGAAVTHPSTQDSGQGPDQDALVRRIRLGSHCCMMKKDPEQLTIRRVLCRCIIRGKRGCKNETCGFRPSEIRYFRRIRVRTPIRGCRRVF